MNTRNRHHLATIAPVAWSLLVLVVLTTGIGAINLQAREIRITDQTPAGTSPDPIRTLPLPIVRYARELATWIKPDTPTTRRIDLYRNGAKGDPVAVTMGIPFPPGMLTDLHMVHIEDAQGHPVPALVEPVLRWHFPGGGIRAVRVQFHFAMKGNHAQLHFSIGVLPRSEPIKGWPYIDGLVEGPDGTRVPGVLATLSPQWMSASLIAGPQRPAVEPGPYDRYFARQFEWARALPVHKEAAWLFDRPTTLFQQYVRTGRKDYLEAAVESYRFYMQHIKREGTPGWPICGGGFNFGEKGKPCDSKYVYIEPIKLALALTGDSSEFDTALIKRMVGAWDTNGWNVPPEPYERPQQRFTEREAGLGLLAVVSAWEITGDKDYLQDVEQRLAWLYRHQTHNPDGLGDDGSWRNSWQVHEDEAYNPATDIRGTSPWMTENIIDGLWHAWLVTGDKRIPVMITDFGRYMEKYGWINPDRIARNNDWRFPCSGPDGQISWYWSSAHATFKQLATIESSDGWYSDAHNVEMTLPVAAALYFETDPAQQKALRRRMQRLASSYNLACAANASTPRRFNWNNRGVGVVQWLMHQDATGRSWAEEKTAAVKQ